MFIKMGLDLEKLGLILIRGNLSDDDWARGGALFDVTKLEILENNQYQAWQR